MCEWVYPYMYIYCVFFPLQELMAVIEEDEGSGESSSEYESEFESELE